jgi:predicted ATP-dependent protease
MRPAPPPSQLGADQVAFHSDVGALGIRWAREVAPSRVLGDARGADALAMALAMSGPGYHVFACGIEGPDRLERLANLTRSLLQREAPPPDWVFVNDFRDATRPRALRLAAGQGLRLRADLAAFVAGLREDLPKAFREESFDDERRRLVEAFEERRHAKQKELEELARRGGFVLGAGPDGSVVLTPLVDGQPIESEEQYRALGEDRIARLEEARKQIAREIRERFEEDREERRRVDREIGAIEREFAARIVRPRVRSIAERHANAKVTAHLDELTEHLLDHLEPFSSAEAKEPPLLPFLPREPLSERLAIYDVNVAVDNSGTAEPPVVVVDSPTYKNLFGTVDRVFDRAGRVVTDFRHVHAGALLRADGGAVVLSAEDALVEPFVWRILRRALRAGRVEIETYDPFVFFTISAIRPEPVDVTTKVVCCGPRWLFEALRTLDTEFRDLFKVLADFSPVLDRDADATRLLCGRIADLAEQEHLLPFEASGLDALVELAVREAGDRRKIAVGGEIVLDMAREASARARRAGLGKVTRDEVESAVRERVHRLDRIEQELRSEAERGVLRIEVEGRRVGQVNALAVAELGGHAFGRPTRVTAAVGLGEGGVLSVEREVELSSPTHSKGVLILQGFLRDRFSRRRPLSLVATLAFEQSYGAVAGDSASLAELLALLSQIGGFALRQDLAVTGSVDQAGEVQAVGGITEKVEGFFDCCRVKGLRAGQGVVVPSSNVEHLVLRADVAAAIARGEFCIHPVRRVEEALEAMTGFAAGSHDEPETLLAAVDRALEEMARRLLAFSAPPRVEGAGS